MSYLPLNIDMCGLTALVVGAGAVASRKIAPLLEAGANVRIVSPTATPEVEGHVAAGTVSFRAGRYEASDLDDVYLVVATTNDPETNVRVAADARLRGILVSVATEPEAGNCTFPARLRRGDLEIGVSTNGTCPGFAAEVRDVIADIIGVEYGIILQTLAAEREKLLTDGSPSTYNREILRSRARELIKKHTERKESGS